MLSVSLLNLLKVCFYNDLNAHVFLKNKILLVFYIIILVILFITLVILLVILVIILVILVFFQKASILVKFYCYLNRRFGAETELLNDQNKRQ